MRENDGKDPAERATDRLQDFASLGHVLFYFRGFFYRQARRFVQKIPADIELADIVKQRRGAYILNALGIKTHFHGNFRGVDRNSIGMVLRVLILGDELAKDNQQAIVGFSQLANLGLHIFVESAHRIGDDHQRSAPDGNVKPLAVRHRDSGTSGKGVRIEIRHQHDQATTRHSRERSVPPSIKISGKYGGQDVEAKNHAVHADHVIQEHRDEQQGKKQPQLPINFFYASQPG